MVIFVEYDDQFSTWEITQDGGLGVLTTASTRQQALKAARRFANDGEGIDVKGPRMSQFKQVR